MGKFVYNKLVRDRIPGIIIEKGEKAVTHEASDAEFEEALYQKINEEVVEFKNNPSAEEMADIIEILNALRSLKNISAENVETERQKKAAKRGAFTKRIILEWTED